MPHVTSTLSASQSYDFIEKLAGGELHVYHSIVIQGGANVPNKNLITLDGVVTEISKKDADMLKDHPNFKRHQERGFVKLHMGSKADTKGLEAEDSSAPLNKEKCRKKGLAAPMD